MTVADEVHAFTIAQLAELIDGRRISPIELTDHFLARIAAIDGQIGSFVTVTSDRARRDAKLAEQEIAAGRYRGPMHGVPFALKDIYNTVGIRTTAQSKLLVDNIPEHDATVARRLCEAGAILLGKNATWEFAHGGPSWDVAFPPARNPWNTSNDPGGSSSGSAAAVAAGLTPVSMGSDTGGSIRDPAAACGVVGFKPTYGRISRHGVIPNAVSHDHCGPITWTVEDSAIVMSVVAGYDPLCPGSIDLPVPDYRAALTGSIAGLRMGTVRQWFEWEARATNEVLTTFEESLRVLRDLGASVQELALAPLQAYSDAKKIIAMTELFTIHSRDLRIRPHLFGDNMRYRILGGALLRAEDYIQAGRWRRLLAVEMKNAFTNIDLLVLPTIAGPAGKLEATPPESLFTVERTYTTPFNVSGFPALAMCNGFTTSGMPLSLQLVGRPFEEALVLRAAHAYERATPWREHRPTVVPQA